LTAQRAGALAHLAREGVEQLQGTRVAAVFLDLGDASEGETGAAQGFGAREPFGLEAIRFELDVLGQLEGEVLLEILPAQSLNEAIPRLHGA
jgi:hypothetical protein